MLTTTTIWDSSKAPHGNLAEMVRSKKTIEHDKGTCNQSIGCSFWSLQFKVAVEPEALSSAWTRHRNMRSARMMLSNLIILLFTVRAYALNFEWERDQLTQAEKAGLHAIRSTSRRADIPTPRGCKVIPGDVDWPSDEQWAAFNRTLGGALLKPKPLASACYTGPDYNTAKCEQLRSSWTGMSMQ